MPGWYPDPTGTPQLRFFDGSDWTEQVGPLPAALTALPPAPGAPIPLPPVRASNVGRIIVIVSGLVIIALIPLALRGVKFRAASATAVLRRMSGRNNCRS